MGPAQQSRRRGEDRGADRRLAGGRSADRPCPPHSDEPGSPYAPGSPGSAVQPSAAPLEGEPVIGKTANSAFVGTGLEAVLDDIGATTLVLCGVLTPHGLEATARHAGNLGYSAFVVGDACWAVDIIDLRGQARPAEDVHALSLADLHGEYARIVTPPPRSARPRRQGATAASRGGEDLNNRSPACGIGR